MIKKLLRKLKLSLPENLHPKSKEKLTEAISAVFILQENQKQKIFMIKHQGSLKGFPGYHMFPWAKIKETNGNNNHLSALYKMIDDELAFDIQAARQTGLIKQIKQMGTVETMELAPFRFSNTFFCIQLSEKPKFSTNTNTVVESEWKTPEQYLQLYQKGQILTLPSTINLLKIMQTDLTNESQKEFEFSYDNHSEVPWFQPLAGVYQLVPISFTFPPDYVHRTNCFVFGDADDRVVMVDPALKNDHEYRKLVNTLKKLNLNYTDIFLTHHHGDHYQKAPNLAREFSIPITMSRDTHRRILRRKGEMYFSGVQIKFAREGDTITQWQGKKVNVYEIPGHDEGQLALAPESMEWFIVGDLIQSTSTVVIGGDEGDMEKYYQSLERVIQLNPLILLPSHGIPIGTTDYLKDTLKHRRFREKQILHLYQKGNTPEQMVRMIYQGVDRRLWPLALENIKSHLKKLKKEQAI